MPTTLIAEAGLRHRVVTAAVETWSMADGGLMLVASAAVAFFDAWPTPLNVCALGHASRLHHAIRYLILSRKNISNSKNTAWGA